VAALYDRQLTAVLDQLIPLREVTRRPRPSDPWFGAECRAAKRQWFQSYLTSRTQYVRRGTTRSTIVQLICGVPQGSVFIMYTADLVPLIQLHCLSPHLYADDTQIYGASGPSDFGALPQKITAMSDSCCRLDVGQSAPTVFR